MLTTAKSILLLDASGLNISPITDITSLYYESPVYVNNTSIITRKYVYSGFPVSVSIGLEYKSIGTVSPADRPHDLTLYDNGQFYKIVDASDNNQDILVSNISTSIMPGTTYRQIDVTNYNLSEILSYYTPLDLIDASTLVLNTSISIINENIDEVSTRIDNISTALYANPVTLSELMDLADNSNLVPNRFYLITDYCNVNYIMEDGCMDIPRGGGNLEDLDLGFYGPGINESLSLLVKAFDSSNLDYKLYNMYINSTGKSLDVYGTYKIIDPDNKVHKSRIRITWLKDQYGNEAPYDFYNLQYNGGSGSIYYWTYNYDSSNMLIDENTKDNAKNNIIKTDPFESNTMPIFNFKSTGSIINNNYIGNNNNINISSNFLYISNNNILNSNNISLNTNGNLRIENSNIFNNNNISNSGQSVLSFYNLYINNNNTILLNLTGYTAVSLRNLIINSSNIVNLYCKVNSLIRIKSNITILNNCNGSINLSANIIVDSYVDTTPNASLNTESNSAYLFGLRVYANSFNTLNV